MEPIKNTLLHAIQKDHGPAKLVLHTSDRCISVCIEKYSDYYIYIRPDDRECSFLCHYIHREDVVSHNSPEVMMWMEQNVFQLVRQVFISILMDNIIIIMCEFSLSAQVKGRLSEFVPVALWYIRMAVARMEAMGELGRRVTVPQTFAEAIVKEKRFPRPRTPENVRRIY
jgi:hypothetical protein